MKLTNQLTDDAVLQELGERIARRRIDLELTQAQLAEQAGVAKRTLERMEAGRSSQLSSLIRVLRVLQALPAMDGVLPQSGPRPMDLLKREGKRRLRASSKRRQSGQDTDWEWGDES